MSENVSSVTDTYVCTHCKWVGTEPRRDPYYWPLGPMCPRCPYTVSKVVQTASGRKERLDTTQTYSGRVRPQSRNDREVNE